ncbi:acyltransferase [Rugamonas sp.]|uniref:acyltransferase family protein n=1 Tax=Rugamonas sp. TaxID=1926287 RepID=UPI0025FAFBA9|nr:acyltransferase [Rugamonas sp.]
MKKEFSLYLDLMRFVAAVLVVIYHSNSRLLSVAHLPFSNHGHAAVIVFFVLSGYVIAHITAQRENTPLEYWSSRLARFYSLALPVVLLCPLLDHFGRALAPAFYEGRGTPDLIWLRMLTSLSFLNEVWTVSIMSFSNTPYWSLCYEMWYYIGFAIVIFTRGRSRATLLAAVALLLGPKILLLAPVWALGVVLQRWQWLQRLPPLPGALLWIASFAAYAGFQAAGLTDVGADLLGRIVGPYWLRQLAFSKFVITDYPLALIVAANFAGARAMAPMLGPWLLPLARPIRWLSSYTFSLYIMHQPLLQFYSAAINGDPRGPLFYCETMAATLLTVWAAGTLTEHRRGALRRRIHGWLAALFGSRWWQRRVSGPLGARAVQG